ncbi:YeaC family protein [Sansalvadorimonas sp. 2012CJ34-2]|uniref:YeaC family protein n=1 Tax=Parendozoicomonas callyspongiae TaxID=2942213 RepID=A0ABT0PM87_9GAMM|nr:DUF1315 family protein [Sansalvadorimonas sp. 2012CJ34-2]MCL6272096.1 YeaC family protein [Sansalvadorimonas sp. 2012CJ34-2]
MDFEQLLKQLTPEIVSSLKRAVELGKWPDGRVLTPEQREQSLQAVLAWEARNLPEEQRTGYLAGSCKNTRSHSEQEDEKDSILRFQDA